MNKPDDRDNAVADMIATWEDVGSSDLRRIAAARVAAYRTEIQEQHQRELAAAAEKARAKEREACAKHVYLSADLDQAELWAEDTVEVNEYIRAVAAEIARGEHRK